MIVTLWLCRKKEASLRICQSATLQSSTLPQRSSSKTPTVLALGNRVFSSSIRDAVGHNPMAVKTLLPGLSRSLGCSWQKHNVSIAVWNRKCCRAIEGSNVPAVPVRLHPSLPIQGAKYSSTPVSMYSGNGMGYYRNRHLPRLRLCWFLRWLSSVSFPAPC